MDKQKQIEEMAKVLLEASCKGSECENCAFVKSVKEAKETCVCLKALYKAGYRKIPENAVVLSKEEQMARDYECYNLGYETHRQESQKREDYIKTLEYHINDLERALIIARKGTAEKFAERLKEKLEENSPFVGYDLEDLEFDGETIQECIDEICEELSEGKV